MTYQGSEVSSVICTLVSSLGKRGNVPFMQVLLLVVFIISCMPLDTKKLKQGHNVISFDLFRLYCSATAHILA